MLDQEGFLHEIHITLINIATQLAKSRTFIFKRFKMFIKAILGSWNCASLRPAQGVTERQKVKKNFHC